MKITLLMLIVIVLLIECIVGEYAVEVKPGRKARLIRPRGWYVHVYVYKGVCWIIFSTPGLKCEKSQK